MISMLPMKNDTCCSEMIFVFLVPSVLLYSHERIAKKKAPMRRLAAAMSTWVMAVDWMKFKRVSGMAFCGCLDGSRFRYPFSWDCRSGASRPSDVSRGSGR